VAPETYGRSSVLASPAQSSGTGMTGRDAQDEASDAAVRSSPDLPDPQRRSHGDVSIPLRIRRPRRLRLRGRSSSSSTRKLSWGDLFHPGWGFDIEIDLMFGDGLGERTDAREGLRLRGLAAVMVDEYSGNSVTDSGGNSSVPII